MSECEMIPFPLASRIGKVRRCAEVLQKSPTNAARDVYWKKTINQLGDKLADIGIPDGEISRQIRQFREAVQQEYLRRDYVVVHTGKYPEGAA